jgi:hypothetical protein
VTEEGSEMETREILKKKGSLPDSGSMTDSLFEAVRGFLRERGFMLATVEVCRVDVDRYAVTVCMRPPQDGMTTEQRRLHDEALRSFEGPGDRSWREAKRESE